ncbi:hypothetical protein Poli38472_001951 [Pythium oligandrum]|uniref:Ankyrin repeat protein n=1 Tax=Pythium oligandrum TaxID=41045 RepID=A0A8K1FMV8_PYTOL|nr:hypothetical protein Poli38472_001951 [Pythium oligandrum]|eukprot:TMW69795.1 hypothetical protein Poli38472_001951 [Pythium oligandrum]
MMEEEVERGRLDHLHARLAGGGSFEVTDEANKSALHEAAALGQLDLIRLLLIRGLSLEAKDGDGWTPLCRAVQAGQRDSIDFLLAHGTDPNASSQLGSAALFETCRDGRDDVAKKLLDAEAKTDTTDSASTGNACARGNTRILSILRPHGLDVNAVDNKTKTPLHYASEKGSASAAAWLLKHGADVNAQDNAGKSPLHCAARSRCLGVVNVFLAHGAIVDALDKYGSRTALHDACAASSEDEAIVSALLSYGFDANLPDRSGLTPLHACFHGNVEAVKLLLKRDVDDRMTEYLNKTSLQSALHSAVTQGHVEIAEILLQSRVDTHIVSNLGYTALSFAAFTLNDIPMVKVFLRYESVSDASAEYFNTALIGACESGHLEVAEMLLDHGVSPSHEALCSACGSGCSELVQMLNDRNGQPHDHPLYYAAVRGRHEIINLLLTNGADIQAHDTIGRTALHSACMARSEQTVAYLIEHGIDLDDQDNDGKTAHGADSSVVDWTGSSAMDDACRRFNPIIAQTLLSHGVSVSSRDATGRTPLHIADEHLSPSVTALLIEHRADIHARDETGSTPLMRCLASKIFYVEWMPRRYRTAHTLAAHGGKYDESPDDCMVVPESIRDQVSGLACLVELWITQREARKPLIDVPIEVVQEGLTSVKGFLNGIHE